MRRRDFITLLGGAAAARPLAARAQRPTKTVIGFLSGAVASRSDSGQMRENLAAFRQGLAEAGFIENQNLTIEYRWAEDQYERLPALAADLVRRQVAAIVVYGSTPGALAAQAATRTIPIIYLVGTDPVKVGLAASLAHPGANLTGVTLINVELIAKCLSVIHELVPSASTIAVLVNPANRVQTETEIQDVQAASRALGLRVLILNASSEDDLERAFATIAAERAGALVLSGEYFFSAHIEEIVALAARYSVPAIHQYREFTAAGGLMNYGPSVPKAYETVGNYTGRILKGEKPSDLPVQQVTRIDLVINLKTAKALGIDVPPTLLIRADEVIE
jgi:putative tryptophan/tyrosine transport system substrate-binding protein